MYVHLGVMHTPNNLSPIIVCSIAFQPPKEPWFGCGRSMQDLVDCVHPCNARPRHVQRDLGPVIWVASLQH